MILQGLATMYIKRLNSLVRVLFNRTSAVFLNQARRPVAGAPGFLKSLLCRVLQTSVCLCVSVCPPPRQ